MSLGLASSKKVSPFYYVFSNKRPSNCLFCPFNREIWLNVELIYFSLFVIFCGYYCQYSDNWSVFLRKFQNTISKRWKLKCSIFGFEPIFSHFLDFSQSQVEFFVIITQILRYVPKFCRVLFQPSHCVENCWILRHLEFPRKLNSFRRKIKLFDYFLS